MNLCPVSFGCTQEKTNEFSERLCVCHRFLRSWSTCSLIKQFGGANTEEDWSVGIQELLIWRYNGLSGSIPEGCMKNQDLFMEPPIQRKDAPRDFFTRYGWQYDLRSDPPSPYVMYNLMNGISKRHDKA